ncbi:MAG: hypothetical protein AB7T48_10100 [Solirubrobacterales bacterium]
MSSGTDRTPTRFAVDFGIKTAEIELASGLILATPLSESAAAHSGDVARTDYDLAAGEQTVTFPWGATATFEIGPVEAPRAPVVYLDQNHWVELARQQWSPEKVPAPHRDGYARL